MTHSIIKKKGWPSQGYAETLEKTLSVLESIRDLEILRTIKTFQNTLQLNQDMFAEIAGENANCRSKVLAQL